MRFLLFSVFVVLGLVVGVVVGLAIISLICSGTQCRGFTPRMGLLMIGCAASGVFFSFWFVKSQMEKSAPWFVAVMDWSEIKKNRLLIVVSVASVLFFVPYALIYERFDLLWFAFLIPGGMFLATFAIDWIQGGKDKNKG